MDKIDSTIELSEEVVEHIEETLDFIRGIFYRVAKQAEELEIDETLPLTRVAGEIAPEYNLTQQYMYPIIKAMVRNGTYPGFKVRAGAKGGLAKIPGYVPLNKRGINE